MPHPGGTSPNAPAGNPTDGHDSISSSKKVLFDKYEVGRLLGCGAFAKVYHARDVRTGHSVAIKCFNKQKILKKGLTDNIKREISVMRRLRHPNIVRLFEVLASRDKIYFVMEFVKGGELFSHLESKGRQPEDLCRKYFQQLISAVGFCHSRGVFHRDLKPENLLIDENGDLKVSDFGLSAVADQIKQDEMLHTMCGTPAYVAPEILAKKGYDGAKVDVWSCGVILFVLLAGYLPFNDPNLMLMYRKIYHGEYRFPKWMSLESKQLIARLLDTNPSTRITIDEIFNNPWFRKNLSEDEWANLSKFHTDEEKSDDDNKRKKFEKSEVEEMENRVLNAFDIISMSQGFDLSGLFEPAPVLERLLSTEPAEVVFRKLENSWTEEGLAVRRRSDKGLVRLEASSRTGKVAASVEVYRLSQDIMVVEVKFYGKVWEEKLRASLDGLGSQPVAPVADSNEVVV